MPIPELNPAERDLLPIQGPSYTPEDLEPDPQFVEPDTADEATLWRRTMQRAQRNRREGQQHGGSEGIGDDEVIGYWLDETGAWVPVYWGEYKSYYGLEGDYTRAEAEELGRASGYASYPSDAEGNLIDLDTSRRSGRGSGASSQTGPSYVQPDRGSLEDQVKAYVVAVTGSGFQNVIDAGVDAMLAADKANFDSPESQIDAWQAMKEVVRGTQEYSFTNEGRPDSVDELEWTSSRQAKLRQLGVSAQRAEELGIDQARAGATDDDLVGAAQVDQIATQGTLHQTQRNALKQSISSVARMVK